MEKLLIISIHMHTILMKTWRRVAVEQLVGPMATGADGPAACPDGEEWRSGFSPTNAPRDAELVTPQGLMETDG